MTFWHFLLIGLIALLGPLLVLPTSWRLPVVLGELIGGLVLGRTGFGVLDAGDPTFTFLANLGFALTMFVAGSHVPIRDESLRPALVRGFLRAIAVGVLAGILGFALAQLFNTGHGAVYAVLMASSSAALVLPTIDNLGLSGADVLQTVAQVAIADTACIVALPLVIEPSRAGRAAVGALLIAVCATVLFLALRSLDRRGIWEKVRTESHQRHLAVELRVSLIVLAGFCALAVRTHVSIMLAGFACGLAVAAVGEPQRLAKQLFALSDGFLSPLFFVWLGASLSLRTLGTDPKFMALGAALGVGAIAVHLAMRALGQPLALGALSAAQLGVPVAAATIGEQSGTLAPGIPAALILGALITVVGLAIASGQTAKPQVRG
ncbi:MAG: sodium/hydrogen exchanger [Aeromicrobium sp.]|nr:sodium/hydrogen exchanger [Aeromicrobium sp.]